MKLPDARTPLGMVDANAPGPPRRRIIRSASRNRGSEKGAAALGSNERDGVLDADLPGHGSANHAAPGTPFPVRTRMLPVAPRMKSRNSTRRRRFLCAAATLPVAIIDSDADIDALFADAGLGTDDPLERRELI